MTLKDQVTKVKAYFGFPGVYVSGISPPQEAPVGTTRAAMSKKITTKIASFMVGLSRWDEMSDAEVAEQCYQWEPEVGGAIDRMSTLVGQSFKGFVLNDVDKTESDLEKKMLKEAEKLWRDLHGKNIAEMYTEMILIFGDLFLERKDNFGLSILPNRFVTVIENEGQLTTSLNTIMTDENILVFCERVTEAQRLIPKENFIHIKYKDTPVFATDLLGRSTWGMYSVSPVQRAILSTWQKRQTQIIDILWRWKMVPREIHSIDSTIFSSDKYTGTPAERRASAQADADVFLAQYSKMMEDQQPDQGYTILDTVKIDTLQAGKGGTIGYMNSNDLIKQLDDKVWTALNVPKSVVTGESAGSYASELVVSNYVSEKVIQLAEKIRPVILENLRARLKAINGSYPVDELDMKLELNMATSKLEMFRQAAMMGSLNAFTQDEIREIVGFKPLTEKQKKDVVQSGGKTPDEVGRDVGQMDPVNPKYPETPESDGQHKRDASQATTMKAERG